MSFDDAVTKKFQPQSRARPRRETTVRHYHPDLCRPETEPRQRINQDLQGGYCASGYGTGFELVPFICILPGRHDWIQLGSLGWNAGFTIRFPTPSKLPYSKPIKRPPGLRPFRFTKASRFATTRGVVIYKRAIMGGSYHLDAQLCRTLMLHGMMIYRSAINSRAAHRSDNNVPDLPCCAV